MLINSERIDIYLEWLKTKMKLDNNSRTFINYDVKRGQVYHCHFGQNIGSEQTKRRPCVILQNDKGNHFSYNTIVAPITHTQNKLDVVIPIADQFNSSGQKILDGNVLLGNVITIHKARLDGFITVLPKIEMDLVDEALAKSLDLYKIFEKKDRITKDKEDYIAKLKIKSTEKDERIKELEKKIEELEKNTRNN